MCVYTHYVQSQYSYDVYSCYLYNNKTWHRVLYRYSGTVLLRCCDVIVGGITPTQTIFQFLLKKEDIFEFFAALVAALPSARGERESTGTQHCFCYTSCFFCSLFCSCSLLLRVCGCCCFLESESWLFVSIISKDFFKIKKII